MFPFLPIQGRKCYRTLRLNRSKRFVRRSLIGRIGAFAAMENLKYPPMCSPCNGVVVGGTLPREGSAKKEALGSKSSDISELLPLQEPSVVLRTPEHPPRNCPLTVNIVNVR
ncbi:unnamed protein product, partial [Laminaria digitata]